MRQSIFLLVALIVVMPATVLAEFRDVSNTHENHNAINYAQSKSIVQGFPDGTYRPDARINRAEFIKILMYFKFGESMVNMCGSATHFNDVPADAWYNKSFCRARDEDIIEGYPDGTARPEQLINFAEAAKIIALTDTAGYGYPDLTEKRDGPWYRQYVDYLAMQHAIPMNITDFDALVTRGQMAEMIYRLDARINTFASQTYESLARLPSADSQNQTLQFFFSIHPTLGDYLLTLDLKTGATTVFDTAKKIVLNFDGFAFSSLLKMDAAKLENGIKTLQEYFTIVDHNIDGFKDIRLKSGSNQYQQFIFDSQRLKFFSYGQRPAQSEADSQEGAEFCVKNADKLADLPLHPSYTKFADMGRLFTASDCGTQRYNAVLHLFPQKIEHMEITLFTTPSMPLYNALYGAGMACSDNTVLDSMKCQKWSKYHASSLDAFLGLKAHAESIATMNPTFSQ